MTNNSVLCQPYAPPANAWHHQRQRANAPRPENEIWNYQQIELGFNYRMTDIQALGLSQMDRLDEYVALRHDIAGHYNAEFETSANHHTLAITAKPALQLPPVSDSVSVKPRAEKRNDKLYDALAAEAA